MIDVDCFSKSLKATWVKKYLDEENQGKWKLFFDLELEVHGGPITLTSNLNTEDVKKLRLKDSFIKEVLTIWAEANFEDRIISENQFLNQKLCHNSLIRIDNSPVFYPEWHYKGITKVKHLKDDSNNFLSLLELQAKFRRKTCPLRHYGLVSALKLLWNVHKNNYILEDSEYESFSEKYRNRIDQAHLCIRNWSPKNLRLLFELNRNGWMIAIQKIRNASTGTKPIN